MADPLRHRQTKGAATDMVDLTPPRHIPTLPRAVDYLDRSHQSIWPVRHTRATVLAGADGKTRDDARNRNPEQPGKTRERSRLGGENDAKTMRIRGSCRRARCGGDGQPGTRPKTGWYSQILFDR